MVLTLTGFLEKEGTPVEEDEDEESEEDEELAEGFVPCGVPGVKRILTTNDDTKKIREKNLSQTTYSR